MTGEFSISPDEARRAHVSCLAQVDRLDALAAAASVQEFIDYGDDCGDDYGDRQPVPAFGFQDKAVAFTGFERRVAQVRAQLLDMAEKFLAIAEGYAEADLDSLRWIGGGR
ncbi:hypothetical protein [Actinokineospora inagensis]|uniref:hypothetical protein n=1 Tax=Actinokineospora inagensis TaxID=103730 RepID=UPI00041234A9|nr:hypothetical protein [Actinokineospora inagensis]